MTLYEIARFICDKVGKVDASSLTACKGYVRQRHQMVYDAMLWKDTMVYTSTTMLPVADGLVPATTTYDPVVPLPYDVARVIQVRQSYDGTKDNLGVREYQWHFSVHPDEFENTGRPIGFTDTGTSGISFPLRPLGTGEVITIACTDPNDVGKRVAVIGEAAGAGLVRDDITLAYGSNSTNYGWTQVHVITKDVTDAYLAVQNAAATKTMLIPGPVTEARVAAIRLVPTPEYTAGQSVTLYVLGKRPLRPMQGDNDMPMIPGTDNVLIALGQADMLERSRQYAKAQAKVVEGMELLKLAKDQETNQSAKVSQVCPEVALQPGSVDDFGW